jgi:hypothetical protein
MAKTSTEPVLPRILTFRRLKVVLDSDRAALYEVPTKRLNEAVRRNAGRFPSDFCFSLTVEEATDLRSQSVTLKPGPRDDSCLKSQFATSSLAHGDRRKLPRVFTEHGSLMAANVLRSEKAVQMSLYLVRAFVAIREQLTSNLAVLRRLAEIDKKLIEHDVVLSEVVKRLQPLLNPPPDKKKPKIGFYGGHR